MKLLISFLFIFILITVVACSGNSGASEEFAKCLTANGATMYGTEWCSHCKNQKKVFGDSFTFVDYVDCDASKGECIAAGVQGYPTWVIDGNKYPGDQPLSRLSSLTNCPLS